MFLIDPNKTEVHLKTISIGCQCGNCEKDPETVITAPPDTIIDILKGILETFLDWEVLKFMSHCLSSAWKYNYYLRTNPSKADIRWLFKKKVSNGWGCFNSRGCSFVFN
nr:Agno [Scorpion polyomavirus 1]